MGGYVLAPKRLMPLLELAEYLLKNKYRIFSVFLENFTDRWFIFPTPRKVGQTNKFMFKGKVVTLGVTFL